MALAVIERAGDDRDGAVGLEADAAHLLVGGRRDLEIAADPDAAQQAALPGGALAGGETLPVGTLERLAEHGGKIARVVGHAGGGRVGQLARRDLVAPA